MLGYLKRGETYRRRGRARGGAPGPAAGVRARPVGHPRRSSAGRRQLADTPHRYAAAADRYGAYVALDNRAPRVLYKLAFARYNDRHPAEAIDALQQGDRARRSRLPKRTTCSGCASATRSSSTRRREALEKAVELAAGAAAGARGAGRSVRRARTHRRSRLSSSRRSRRSIPVRRARSRWASPTRARVRPQRAVRTLSRAAERYPDYPYTYVALGRVWLEERRRAAIASRLSKALERAARRRSAATTAARR